MEKKPFNLKNDFFKQLPKIERVDSPLGRRYATPNGLYPSVTTVLSSYGDKTQLEEWKIAVGAEEAKIASDKGLARGTILHNSMENYVIAPEGTEMHFNSIREITSFKAAKKAIDDHVTDIYGQELFLYSDKYEIAGACDMIGLWDNQPAIIDFKTSSNLKYFEEIESYWLQTTAYSEMCYERTGLKCNKLVIVMAILDEPKALIYTREITPDLIDMLIEARELFSISNEL